MVDKVVKKIGGAEAESNALREKILNAQDSLNVRGTVFYVSSNGDDANDGLSPETAVKTFERLSKLPVLPETTVLFERGSVFRIKEPLWATPGVGYGTYGNGEKPKIIIKIFKAIIIINNRINALIHIIKRKNVKHIMLCIIKYNILPSSKSPLKMVTLSIELNNKVFYGGLNLNTKYGKLTKLHLISATGLEIEHILPHPLVIIPTRSSVYLCGKFIDENGTPQRKISLTTRATNITIDNQAVRIKGIR